MRHLRRSSITALVLAMGLVASACSGESSSRQRNSALEQAPCYATQEERTRDVEFFVGLVAEGETAESSLEQLQSEFDLAAENERRTLLELAVNPFDPLLDSEYSRAVAALKRAVERRKDAQSAIANLPLWRQQLEEATAQQVCAEPGSDQGDVTQPEETTSSVATSEETTTSVDDGNGETVIPENQLVYDPLGLAEQVECPNIVVNREGSDPIQVGDTFKIAVTPCRGYLVFQISTRYLEGAGYPSFTALRPGSTTINVFYQDPTTFERISNLASITVVIEGDTTRCVGKSPELSADTKTGEVVVASTCDDAEAIKVEYRRQDGQLAGFYWVILSDPRPHIFEGPNPLTLTFTAIHLVPDENGQWFEVGNPNQLTVDFPGASPDSNDTQPPVEIALPVDDMQLETEQVQTNNVPTPVIAVPSSVTSLTCSADCVSALADAVEVDPQEVKNIEYSLFDGAWLPLTESTSIPVAAQTSTLRVRVTPTTGQPVTAAIKIARDVVTAEDLGEEAEETSLTKSDTTSAPAENDSSQNNLTWWIVLLIVFMLAVLGLIARKKKSQHTSDESHTEEEMKS